MTPGRAMTLLKRRWRTLGFGIHSPFAYELLTKVIGERGYYDRYDELKSVAPATFRLTSLVFRLCVYFKPSRVAVLGDREDLSTAVKLACGQIEMTNQAETADMVIVADHQQALALTRTLDERPDLLAEKTVVVAELTDAALRDFYNRLISGEPSPTVDIPEHHNGAPHAHSHAHHKRHSASTGHQHHAASAGMDFNDGRIGIACMTGRLPRQSFSIHIATPSTPKR